MTATDEAVTSVNHSTPSGTSPARARKKPRFGISATTTSSIIANAFPILLLLAWYFLSLSAEEYLLPGPAAVLEDTKTLLFGDLASQTYTSFLRVLIAVVLALLIGAVLVFAAVLVPALETLIGGRILPLLNAIPSLGWALVGVVWVGVSDAAVVFVEVAILLPFCMVNLWEGVRGMDREALEMGRSFTRKRSRVVRKIEVILLVPYVIASVRLSFSIGWKLALIAEFFGAETGLGIVMNTARQQFDTPMLFATILVVIVFVFVFEQGVFQPISRAFSRRMGTGGQR
jgi:NitT/TauT family transport system permease protein/sulfonate transport system permease protein